MEELKDPREKGRERRRSGRTPALDGSRGRIRATVEVKIVDISTHGIRMELAASLRPTTVYDLSADLCGFKFSTPTKITRCAAAGYRDDGHGGRVLLFRAGGEFLWNDDDLKRTLGEHLSKAPKAPPGLSSNSGILRLRR